MKKGADFSHWNTPNWTDLRAQGFEFAWLKCTEGITWKDLRYAAYRRDAIDSGFVVGPYHYFRAAWSGIEQAQHFAANAVNDTLPPAIDVEAINNAGFTKEFFKSRLKECLLRTEELFGRRPIIYTSKSKWELLVGLAGWEANYDLWVAHYTTAPQPLIPNGWTDYAVWQYTSTPIDTNRMRDEYWNSVAPAVPPTDTVTLTISRDAYDELHRALHEV